MEFGLGACLDIIVRLYPGGKSMILKMLQIGKTLACEHGGPGLKEDLNLGAMMVH